MQGQAVVLDNPRDPMAIVMMGQGQQAQHRYRQQQLGLQNQKAARDDMNKVLAHKYEDPGDRFKAWGQDMINQANQEVMGIYQNNPNADPIQLRANIMGVQGKYDKSLKYAAEINNIYKEKVASLGEMKGIVDQEEAKRIMNQTIAKDDPYKVDRSILENIEQVPAIYDANSILANSVDDIKTQFRSTTPGAMQSSGLGLFMEIKENKMRFKDMDKTMDYLLRGDDVTDEGIQQKVNGGLLSDRLRYEIAQEEVAAKGGDPQDVSQVMPRFKEIQYDKNYGPQVRKRLKPMLEQFQQEERDVEVKTMGKYPTTSLSEGIKENRLMMRDKNLSAILNPFDGPNATAPKPESKAALSRIFSGDFGGGKITEATYRKGNRAVAPEYMKQIVTSLNESLFNPTDENKKRTQQLLRDAKNHMIQKSGNKIDLRVKTGTIVGVPEELTGLSIDLSDPSAEAIVNALMNKNAGESNIPLDDVYFYRNKGGQKYLDDDDDDLEESDFLDD